MKDERMPALPESTDDLIPMIEFARAAGFRTYAAALNALIAGAFPARRIRGRWYVTRADAERLLAFRHAAPNG